MAAICACECGDRTGNRVGEGVYFTKSGGKAEPQPASLSKLVEGFDGIAEEGGRVSEAES